MEKFVDVMVGVAFPFFFQSLSVDQIGVVVGAYGLSWGFFQLVIDKISDRLRRKWLIVTGMWISCVGFLLTSLSNGILYGLFTSIFTGIGMALLYPALIAAVSDLSPPAWRAFSHWSIPYVEGFRLPHRSNHPGLLHRHFSPNIKLLSYSSSYDYLRSLSSCNHGLICVLLNVIFPIKSVPAKDAIEAVPVSFLNFLLSTCYTSLI